MRRPGGLSILEILVGVLILFLASLYLFSMFASGQRFAVRGREYTAATFLAQNKMEELLACPVDVLADGSGGFATPHQDYAWTVDVEDYEADLKVVTVEVTSPRGARATLHTLRRTTAFYGIACDPATNRVVMALPDRADPLIFEEGAPEAAGPALPDGAQPGRPGGVAGWSGLGLLWVVDQQNVNVQYYRETSTGAYDAGDSLSPPPAMSAETPRFAGAAADAFGNRLFLADRANRGLWILNDSTALGGRTWSGASPFAPADPALGAPSGVAVDPAGSQVWVSDTENLALRMLLVTTAVPTPAADWEQEPGVGWWHRRPYRPTEGMGAPQGVAVNPWGSALFTVDSTHLLLLEFVPKASGGYDEVWSRYPLPDDLAAARPSGLCLDPFRTVVFLATRTGELWKFRLGPPATFTRLRSAP